MKKLLATTSFLVLGSASVLAADLPVKYRAAPIMAAPVFSWTGCYVGVHAGGGAMRDSYTDANGTGGLAGGQVGCNYQDGNWVFGVEGEGYWSGIKSTYSNWPSFSNGEGYTLTAKNKSDFTIAARVGITFDRTLVYGKAGWAWGHFNFHESGVDCCHFIGEGLPQTFPYSFDKSGTLNGLLLGLGIEHALTQNWTVKMEYNFIRYGAQAFAETYCDDRGCVPNGSFSDHADKHLFKVGVNYLFNMGKAPVVAKY
jgi:outer membrane immunogenic protein